MSSCAIRSTIEVPYDIHKQSFSLAGSYARDQFVDNAPFGNHLIASLSLDRENKSIDYKLIGVKLEIINIFLFGSKCGMLTLASRSRSSDNI